jgi:tetratricopeptide (TPR) repeat protein
LTAWASGAALAQPTEPRGAFTNGLGTFSLALRGEFGDEGPRLRSSLEQMRRAVEAWDAGIRTYEAAMAADLKDADPDAAARLHLALGAIYLDRGRVQDGIRELDAAAAGDPARADIQTFRALARSQLARAPAVELFRTAASLAPTDPIRAYQYARSLSASGRTDEAVKELQRFLQIPDPRSQIPNPTSPFLVMGLVQEVPGIEPFLPPALYARGYSLLESGDYAAAVTEFTAALERDPLTAEPGVDAGAILRAASALRAGSIQTAIQHLTVAIELEPQRSEPRRLLGQAYLADDQHEQAAAALAGAIALAPADERTRLALADVFVQNDQLDAALISLTAAIAAIPGSGQAVYELGLVHQRAGRYPEALAAFDQALRLTPLLGANSIHQTIGALRRSQQDFDGAARAFSSRVDLVPNDPEAHRELGDIYLRQGRHTEALTEFATVLLLDPASVEAHALTAQLHLRDGRYPEAIAAATRVLGLDPGHREARYALATSLIRLGRTDEGRKELDIFQQQQAEDTVARTRLFELEGLRREAAMSRAAGDKEKAIALLRRLVDADPTVPGSLLDLGFALIDAGQHAEAIGFLDKAVELGAHYEVHRHLAAAYGVLGQSDDSRRQRALYEQLKRDALRRTGAER